MGKWGKVTVAAINVATQPHSADGYVDLFRAAAGSGLAGKFWGSRAGEFGPVRLEDWQSLGGNEESEQLRVVVGEIHLYTDFDSAKDWFNRKEKNSRPANTLGDMSFLDENKPEHTSIRFAFVVNHHEFFFESKMSPRRMARLLEILLEPPAKAAGRSLFVNVIQQKQALDRIFGMKVLKELRITLRPPNPDDGEMMEKQVLERLAQQRANSLEKVLKSDQGLKPSEETRAEATVATSNGRVVGKGLDGTGNADLHNETVDTADHPRTHSVAVPPKAEKVLYFARAVVELYRRLRQKQE